MNKVQLIKRRKTWSGIVCEEFMQLSMVRGNRLRLYMSCAMIGKQTSSIPSTLNEVKKDINEASQDSHKVVQYTETYLESIVLKCCLTQIRCSNGGWSQANVRCTTWRIVIWFQSSVRFSAKKQALGIASEHGSPAKLIRMERCRFWREIILCIIIPYILLGFAGNEFNFIDHRAAEDANDSLKRAKITL